MIDDKPPPRGRFHPIYLVLAIPYLAYAGVPFYNRAGPELLGIPFFYWWQVFGVLLTVICIYPVYWFEEGRRK